ncbi:hypothetical protein ACQKKK_04240 [Peribacillus sp. NPDC006672]|uniref:hypothetical protein n=1 Tax=Peribacillus sp. NPDC006672 TaxID=3390606 RepID=UPI003D090CA2
MGRIAKNRKVSEDNFIVKKSDNPLRVSISGNYKELEGKCEIVLTGNESWVESLTAHQLPKAQILDITEVWAFLIFYFLLLFLYVYALHRVVQKLHM